MNNTTTTIVYEEKPNVYIFSQLGRGSVFKTDDSPSGSVLVKTNAVTTDSRNYVNTLILFPEHRSGEFIFTQSTDQVFLYKLESISLKPKNH